MSSWVCFFFQMCYSPNLYCTVCNVQECYILKLPLNDHLLSLQKSTTQRKTSKNVSCKAELYLSMQNTNLHNFICPPKNLFTAFSFTGT